MTPSYCSYNWKKITQIRVYLSRSRTPCLVKHTTLSPLRSTWNSKFAQSPKQSIASPAELFWTSEQIRKVSFFLTNLIIPDDFDRACIKILRQPSTSLTTRDWPDLEFV